MFTFKLYPEIKSSNKLVYILDAYGLVHIFNP
jgi:hypothetical protein